VRGRFWVRDTAAHGSGGVAVTRTVFAIDGLLERDHELAVIEGLLGDLGAGRGGVLVVSGPPGIGKSAVLDECVRSAVGRGFLELRGRGDDLVVDSSFATVRELLWGAVQAAGPDVWAGAARLAEPVFGAAEAGDFGGDRAAAVLHGLYWLVAALAERAPLVLCVDDAHRLDGASARFLLYLARRIDSLPVLLLVGGRRGEGRDCVASLAELAAAALPLGPLSEDASCRVVRRALGARAGVELCRSCHEVTGGNPFYLRELTAALAAEGFGRGADVAGRVLELGAGAVGHSVLLRIARLGDDCARVVEAVSVLGPGCALRHAAALAGLPPDRAAAAADALRAADLFAAGQALSFVHPIVSEAVSAQLLDSRRAALHGQAARLLAAEGVRGDRVSAHLMSAEQYGDPWAVDALRHTAAEAVARGAPEVAVRCLHRALAEPPLSECRLDVLVELGRAESLLPSAHDFAALREALALAEEPQGRAEISLELALGLFGVLRTAEGRAVLETALADEASLNEETVELLEAALIGGALDELSATRSLVARAQRHFARSRRGEVRDPRMLSVLSAIGAVTGVPARECAALARSAIADERLLTRWIHDGYVTATYGLCAAERLAEAALAADAGLLEAQHRGSAPMFMQLAVASAEVALRCGNLDAAEAHARRASELGAELGMDHPALRQWLPIVLLERGQLGLASQLVEAIDFNSSVLEGSFGVVLLAHRGRVRIAAGELMPGLADVMDADARCNAAGWSLSVLTDWVRSATLALLGLGRRDDAKRLANRELVQANAFGAPRRRGSALSVSGVLEPGAHGLALLRESVAVLQREGAALEHARALVTLGARLRAHGERTAARTCLSDASDIAHRIGALAVAEEARAELVASGARPRRYASTGPDALTPAELRTARMAAAGLTNRDIAQALFLSTKTVEAQLSQAYAKLSVRGRGELGASLGVSSGVSTG
jgi:DNA-binding CsgD family transcriptional regulator